MLALKGIQPLRWEGHPWLMRNKCAKARNTKTEVATEVYCRGKNSGGG